MTPIVIVGASLAGLRAAQGVRAGGYDGELIVIGAEARPPYTRPPLSKELLAGDHEPARCDFDRSMVDATWRLGETAAALDLRRRRVVLSSGEGVPYRRLILATGCRARPWRGPGAKLTGLFTLRDLDDALALHAALTPGTRLVVVGAGFVGCEVAATARRLGAKVTLVDVAPHPLPQLGRELGRRCAALHARHDVDLRLGVGVAGFAGDDSPHASAGPAGRARRRHLRAVDLDDGTRLHADVAVVALGAVPNTDWLADSGLASAHGGVRCDATLTAVGHPDVLCAGDIASWPHPLADGELVRVEHWTNAAEQGAHAGRNAVAAPDARVPYEAVPYFWTDQYDVRMQSAGFPGRAERVEVIEEEDERFVAVGVRDGRAVAALAWNAPRRLVVYRRALAGRPTLEKLVARIEADEKALGRREGAVGVR